MPSEQAIEFLETHPKDKPFALTVAFFPPKAIGNSKEPGAQWMPKNETRALYDNVTIPEPHNMIESYQQKLPKYLREKERGGRSWWEECFEGHERYQASMKNYYALITQVDEASERIFNKLEKQSILNETLVIFTTDNGVFHGEHGLGKVWKVQQHLEEL
jgi:arylsulfatase